MQVYSTPPISTCEDALELMEIAWVLPSSAARTADFIVFILIFLKQYMGGLKEKSILNSSN